MFERENSQKSDRLSHQPVICQIEITVKDLRVSQIFYGELFAWHLAPIEIHNYHVVETSPDLPYGISFIINPAMKSSSGITIYLAVDDISDLQHKCVQLGGLFLGRTKTLPGYGLVQLIQDPSGNRLGVFQRVLT